MADLLVTVARFTGPLEAHILRGRLEAEAIPAHVYHEHHIWMHWLLSHALGGVRVWVHPRNVEKAKEIIEAIRQGEYEIPDDVVLSCPSCLGQRVIRNRISWTVAFLIGNLLHLPVPFVWARHECLDCHRIWKPETEREHSLVAIFLASLAAGLVVLTLFLALYCRPNYDGSSIFPKSGGCTSYHRFFGR